jgi:hemin uptake protein HemP
MYFIAIDHIIYGQAGGLPYTLPEALRQVHGCANARILREDGTVIVSHAGSDYAVRHLPSGRLVRRRGRAHHRFGVPSSA